jgi:hypothetical protein
MATVHLPKPITIERIIVAALWVAQVVLASVFAVNGIINLTAPIERLVESTTWAATIPLPLIRVIGAIEILGAVSLMLPTSSLLLTHVAGWCAAVFAALATVDIIARFAGGLSRGLVLQVFLIVVTGLVAWERLRRHRDLPP